MGHKGGSCVHAKACLGPPRRCSFPSPTEAPVLQVRSDLLDFSRHLVKQPHPQWEDHGVGTDQAFHISDTRGTENRPQYLREFHLHVSKYMEEANHCVPQPAVSQALLVPNARTLGRGGHSCLTEASQAALKFALVRASDINSFQMSHTL